jgi:hypothetical protein
MNEQYKKPKLRETRTKAEVEKAFKEQEERDRWYWGWQHANCVKNIEQGKKNPQNCQKCGGQGFISFFKSYNIESKPLADGTSVTGRRWIWTVSPCECLTLRRKVEKSEKEE